ncbi:hypothetical protein HGO34_14445 [Agrobacterium vitis]|uniref:Uncharacterized protein n=1 Tax=Agrobacterium vitis TaxID=373 RepID=A0AAE4WFM3_AGRVI|nr:hypothetical protein [Agrobacterium vitis]MCF1499848.1 hypothetical protein [Allorhizobium sp. Av2]MCM2440916.1 hypothetical protein [Agrobacterium vitis]MUZ59105.1 hypothetical protein [Agrobacterium vitis]MVA66754.1 hypothetical protein [Agrobacterium vitis]MVA87197.1 hypothetical protein [Agrobacterium vitis]
MSSKVNIYVFSSKSITNIWAGYGAQTWAVSIGEDASNNAGKKTKSKRMTVGSFGILYCEPWKAFTVPFVTISAPDLDKNEEEIWDGTWMLPFRFKALGNPKSRMPGSDISKLPGAAREGITNYSHYLKVQGNLAFTTSAIDAEDWEYIIRELA